MWWVKTTRHTLITRLSFSLSIYYSSVWRVTTVLNSYAFKHSSLFILGSYIPDYENDRSMKSAIWLFIHSSWLYLIVYQHINTAEWRVKSVFDFIENSGLTMGWWSGHAARSSGGRSAKESCRISWPDFVLPHGRWRRCYDIIAANIVSFLRITK